MPDLRIGFEIARRRALGTAFLALVAGLGITIVSLALPVGGAWSHREVTAQGTLEWEMRWTSLLGPRRVEVIGPIDNRTGDSNETLAFAAVPEFGKRFMRASPGYAAIRTATYRGIPFSCAYYTSERSPRSVPPPGRRAHMLSLGPVIVPAALLLGPGALNVACWTAVIFTLLLLSVVSRVAWRIGHGRCPWCAYSLVAGQCSECGWKAGERSEDAAAATAVSPGAPNSAVNAGARDCAP